MPESGKNGRFVVKMSQICGINVTLWLSSAWSLTDFLPCSYVPGGTIDPV